MAERSESEGEEVEEPTLRNQLVSSEGDVNFDYLVGSLDVPDSTTSCAIIAVALVDSKVLVCVPEAAWSKKKARRGIMSDALGKVVAVHVPASLQDDRRTPDPAVTMKVWLGFLKEEYEAQVDYGETADSCDMDFPLASTGLRLPPFARALLAVATDHFSFVTAESHGAEAVPAPPGLSGNSGVLDRMQALEEMMTELKQVITAGQPGPVKTRPSALKAKPKVAATPSDLQKLGLDAGVTAAALQAGVTPDALAEMAGVLSGQPNPLNPVGQHTVVNAEDSSEDEVEAAGLGTTAASGLVDPVAQAVVQLTRIVGKMEKAKKLSKDRGLEAILDRAESGSTKEIGGGGASRSTPIFTETSCGKPPIDLPISGGKDAGRLAISSLCTRDGNFEHQCSRMGRASLEDSTVCQQHTVLLDPLRDLGFSHGWSSGRSSCSHSVGSGNDRSTKHRCWKLVSRWGDIAGTCTSTTCFSEPCPAGAMGSSAHQTHRRSFLRSDHSQASRPCRLSGKEVQVASFPTVQTSRPSSSGSQSQTRSEARCKGRKERWSPGRRSRSSCCDELNDRYGEIQDDGRPLDGVLPDSLVL